MQAIEDTRVPGERVEKELNGLIERAAQREGDDMGRAKANASEARYRDRYARAERETRERNRRAWAEHADHMRRTHLGLALDWRRKARELREAV